MQLTIPWKPGIKWPRRETENQQRSRTKKRDERDITPLSGHLQVVYQTAAPSHAANKKDF